MVPTGTFSTMLSPSRPVQFEPSPWRPRSPVYSGLKRKCTSVLWRSLDSMTMSPPRPPSPPEGPPRGTNFSRRKAMHPLPPSPAFTRITASSINMPIFDCTVQGGETPESSKAALGRRGSGSMRLAHGGNASVDFFLADNFDLSRDIPVVAADIAHVRGAIAVELVSRSCQRSCASLHSASIRCVSIRDVDLQGARHRGPFRAGIGQFDHRITDSECRMADGPIRALINGDLCG